MDTGLVAEQFETNRQRVQQLAKEYREAGEIHSWRQPDTDPAQTILTADAL